MTKSEMQSKANSTKSQINSAKTNKSNAQSQLNRVSQAKSELTVLKEEANGYKSDLATICDDIESSWRAKKANQFTYNEYSINYTDAKEYINEIDDVLDSLVDKERELKDEINDYGIIIEQLNDLWLNVTSTIEKLFN